MGCCLKIYPVIMEQQEEINPIEVFRASTIYSLDCGLTIPTQALKQNFALIMRLV